MKNEERIKQITKENELLSAEIERLVKINRLLTEQLRKRNLLNEEILGLVSDIDNDFIKGE